MKSPVIIYLFYMAHAIYTGVYFYNRLCGKSAQFGVTRICANSSKLMKLFTDASSAILFFYGTYVIFVMSFMDR